MRAVANCVSVHSAEFGAQIPTRSPVTSPASRSARARSSTAASSCAHDHRRDDATSTSASPSACSPAVRRSAWPIVSSSSGTSVGPAAYESSVMGG